MVVPVPGRRAVRRGKYCTHRLSARSRRNHVHYDTRPPYGLLPGRCSSLGVLVLKRPACTARSARCLERTQGAKDCTANSAALAAHGRGEFAIRPLRTVHNPPHYPRTHGRGHTQLHQRARLLGREIPRARLHTHAHDPAGERAQTVPALGVPRACERWRGERSGK